MSIDTERVIELSRAKLVMVIAGALLFVAAGAWFALADDGGSLVRQLGRFAAPWMIHALGITTAAFGLACGAYAIRKAFDRRPGLVLDAAGLTDNSSAVAAGFIPWSEVTGIGVVEIQRQKLLVVTVVDPARYVERGNALQRALNRANAAMCGSPIVISSTALRIPFAELHRELSSRLARHAAADAIAPVP